MKRHLGLLLGCLLVGASCTSDPYADLPDPLFRSYDGDDVPGAAVMIIRKGKIQRADGYGMANLEAGRPVTPATNFRLASVTKQFTAMAVAMLVDEGLLGLDNPVHSILDGMPPVATDVTVRHLIQHQSGLLDYESLIPEGFEGQVRDADVLTFISTTDSLYFPPGTDYRYSNTGYALLSLIIEERSGLSFPNFLRTRIFEPLDMTSSVAFVDGENEVANRAFGYTVDGDEVTLSDQSQTSAVLGDGGIYSSLNDLYRWDQALYGDELVSDSLMTLVFTPGLSDYGFGWRIDTHLEHRRYGHTGSTRGFRTVIHRYPDVELTVVVLTNRNGPAVADLAERVAAGYL